MLPVLILIWCSVFEVEVHSSQLKMGIDHGTYVAFAGSDRLGVWKNDGVEVIANDLGHKTTPSIVAFTDSDRLLGDPAENKAARSSENTVFDANRLIGRKFNEPTGVGVWKNDGVEVIANDIGHKTTPSYVAFTDSDRLLGDAAENRAACNPENTALDAKRLIGRKFHDPACAGVWKNDGAEVIANDKGNRATLSYVADSDRLLGDAVEHRAARNLADAKLKVQSGAGDEPVTVIDYPGETQKFHPEEASAVILAKMKEATEAHLGSEVSDAVVTVSATVRNDKWCLSHFEIDRLENYRITMRDTLQEEKLKEKFEGGDKEAIEKFDWLDKNQLAEKDEFEAQQKELMKMHQGGGSPGAVGAGPPAAGGPTVEEVD